MERLRRALDKAAVEKRDLQQKVASTQQALQVRSFEERHGGRITKETSQRFLKPAPDMHQGMH